MYVRIELPFAATVKVVCHYFSKWQIATHDFSNTGKIDRRSGRMCCFGLSVSECWWHRDRSLATVSARVVYARETAESHTEMEIRSTVRDKSVTQAS